MRETAIDYQSIMDMEKEEVIYWIEQTRNVLEKQNKAKEESRF